MSEFIIVFCTTNDFQNAKQIAKQIVNEKLCACVNILPSVSSVYSWENNVQEDDEILMIIKTKKTLFDTLCSRIKELHPYEVPEIISTEIIQGSKSYLDWISNNTL